MKYEPASKYSFECEVVVDGLSASSAEKYLKETLKKIIKEEKPSFACMSNEKVNSKEQRVKIFSTIEELQILTGSKIVHIGKVPENMINSLKEEMESNEEMNAKRLHHLSDCIMISVENESGKIMSAIVDRKGFYCISKKMASSK